VTLTEAQRAAADQNRLFPLSIGSEGTCQIGGILSTNAGGVNVIRYGNMRDLILGVEAVLPDGRIWHGLNRLRKNNTGYDLKHLFIGGEGTLGIVTAAVLKLFPQAVDQATAFLAVPSAAAAVDLLGFIQERSGGQITSFELMNAHMVNLVIDQFTDLHHPVETKTPYYVLVELSAGQKGGLEAILENILADAYEKGLVKDGTLSANQTQSQSLWAIRHNASEAMKKTRLTCVKCDISVPIDDIPAFLEKADDAMEAMMPGTQVIAFGHMGDGNIHYDILAPQNRSEDWKAMATEAEHKVHDIVASLNGSISAEHGIGVLKRDELPTRKTAVEMEMMRSIKNAFDPKGLMNPGKLLIP
ncbi:MAG: FAD-binding oxidoreductase, partial [Pseudomonadota bacterium]